MLGVLRALTLKRFRSIPLEYVEFENPTFVVGQNGSGKSNFVDAFAFLADAVALPLQAVFDNKRGGIEAVRNRSSGKSYPPNMGISVQIATDSQLSTRARYSFEIRAQKNYEFEVVREQCIVTSQAGRREFFDRKGNIIQSSAKGIKLPIERNALALPLLGGDSRFSSVARFLSGMRVYAVEPAKLREMQDPDSGVALRSDGSNAASVIRMIRKLNQPAYERMLEFLRAIVPSVKSVEPKKHGNKLSLEFKQEWSNNKTMTFEGFSMSDGTLRAVGLLAALFQVPRPALLVIEEPEATIHPGALGIILDAIEEASKEIQIIVTTHSTDLLSAKWISDEHIRIASWEHGATRVSRLSEASRETLREHLMNAGELLRSNALVPIDLFDNSNLRQMDLFEEVA